MQSYRQESKDAECCRKALTSAIQKFKISIHGKQDQPLRAERCMPERSLHQYRREAEQHHACTNQEMIRSLPADEEPDSDRLQNIAQKGIKAEILECAVILDYLEDKLKENGKPWNAVSKGYVSSATHAVSKTQREMPCGIHECAPSGIMLIDIWLVIAAHYPSVVGYNKRAIAIYNAKYDDTYSNAFQDQPEIAAGRGNSKFHKLNSTA